MLSGVDLNSPAIQQLIKSNPLLAQQLGIGALAAPILPAPTSAVTMDQVQEAITERMKGFTQPAPVDALAARLQAVAAKAEGVLQRALSGAEYANFQKYVADGGPGFDALLQGEALYPLAQLLWETIKESKK